MTYQIFDKCPDRPTTADCGSRIEKQNSLLGPVVVLLYNTLERQIGEVAVKLAATIKRFNTQVNKRLKVNDGTLRNLVGAFNNGMVSKIAENGATAESLRVLADIPIPRPGQPPAPPAPPDNPSPGFPPSPLPVSPTIQTQTIVTAPAEKEPPEEKVQVLPAQQQAPANPPNLTPDQWRQSLLTRVGAAISAMRAACVQGDSDTRDRYAQTAIDILGEPVPQLQQAAPAVLPPVDLDQPLAFKFSPDDNPWKQQAVAFYGNWLADFLAADTMSALTAANSQRLPKDTGAEERPA